MKIEIEQLQLKYDDFVAIENLDLRIADGESLVLLGQSGCGKTSTMRCVAGLEQPSAGRIVIDGKPVFDSAAGINVAPNKRNVGMVFQSYAVWPHMTVFQNVAYSLKVQKVPRREIRERVMDTLATVGLDSYADRGASLLSGGQMQRVALARSLVMNPSVLLLDEPLSNLDARLRDRLRIELREMQLRLGLTCIYVTHDQGEAFALADRIALMQHGRIVQIGEPQEIYARPASASIADFLGVSNVFACSVANSDGDAPAVRLSGHDLTIRCSDRVDPGAELKVCVRPEDFTVTAGAQQPAGSGEHTNRWPGRVLVSSFQGSSTRYAIQLFGGPEIEVLQPLKRGTPFGVGQLVEVHVDPQAAQILPAEVAA